MIFTLKQIYRIHSNYLKRQIKVTLSWVELPQEAVTKQEMPVELTMDTLMHL